MIQGSFCTLEEQEHSVVKQCVFVCVVLCCHDTLLVFIKEMLFSSTEILTEQDWTVVTKLKDMVDKQRDQLRQVEKALSQKTQDVEAVSTVLDHLES